MHMIVILEALIALAYSMVTNSTYTHTLFLILKRIRSPELLWIGLRARPEITQLNLYFNQLGPDGGVQLANFLEEESISNSILDDTTHGTDNVAKLDAKRLDSESAESVRRVGLTLLNVRNNGLKQGARALLSCLATHHRSLTSLDLSSNNIGPEGVPELGRPTLHTCLRL